MASINWPSALSDVLVSNATVSEPNLAGWWSMNTVSEYPTGTAVYLQGTLSTDTWSGWAYSGAGGSIAINGGNLLLTCGAANCGFVRTMAVAANQTFRLRVTCGGNYGARTISIYNGTTDTTKAITASTSPQVVDILSSLTFATVTIRIANGAATETYLFDWVYIGDGSYAADSLLDNSGLGNHGQIFGCTPGDGVSGNALIGDGTNDRCDLAYQNSTAYTISCWIKRAGSGSSQDVMYFNSEVNVGRFLLRINASDQITAIVLDSTGTNRTYTGPVLDTNWHFIALTISGTTNSLYYDGALVASGENTLSATYYNFGRLFAIGRVTITNYFSGTIDEPRIYNRALSAAEVLYRYQNPSPYSALPSAPLQDGYSETKQNGVIRSSVDAGAPKMRQRFTAVTRQYNVSFALTSNMAQILDYFYYTTTSQGVALFNWTDPRTGASVEARFIEPPVHRPNGPEFISSCTLEVLP